MKRQHSLKGDRILSTYSIWKDSYLKVSTDGLDTKLDEMLFRIEREFTALADLVIYVTPIWKSHQEKMAIKYGIDETNFYIYDEFKGGYDNDNINL